MKLDEDDITMIARTVTECIQKEAERVQKQRQKEFRRDFVAFAVVVLAILIYWAIRH
jgi:hypothetical protein